MAETVGAFFMRVVPSIKTFAEQVRAFGLTKAGHELGPIFRYISVFMLMIFFSLQAFFWRLVLVSEYDRTLSVKTFNTIVLLVSPIVFMTSTFCFFSRPRSESKTLAVSITLPFVYSLVAACLCVTRNIHFNMYIAGASTSTVFFLSCVGGLGVIVMSANSKKFLRTFTDQQLVVHLSHFATAVFPVVFISTYLTAEATSCVAHAREDRCESFVISQYVILINMSCSYVYYCMFG